MTERFWEKVDKRDPDDCWHWTAARNRNGYGTFSHRLAHRVSWEIAYGMAIPDGSAVCHGCDNPPCVNPHHLWLGSQRDNVLDMFAKGRGKHVVPRDNRGARNPMAKLTDATVAEIRRLAGEIPQRQIAERFGIHQSHVSKILSGRRR